MSGATKYGTKYQRNLFITIVLIFFQHPPLVISITGGAKDYNMKPKLLRAFQRGLLKVARTTGEKSLRLAISDDDFCLCLGAWIITGGMNTGVMKLVGDSLQLNQDRSRPVHLIVRDGERAEEKHCHAPFIRSLGHCDMGLCGES